MEWRLSDGTIVRSGGEVIGESTLADELRGDIAHGARVWFRRPEWGGIALDPTSDAMLHRYLEEMGARGRPELAFTFTTGFVFRWEDLPADVRATVAEWDRWEAEPREAGTLD